MRTKTFIEPLIAPGWDGQDRNWYWCTRTDGTGHPICGRDVRCFFDGIDYWQGKECMTGLDEFGIRSSITRITPATIEQVRDWLGRTQIITSKIPQKTQDGK